MISGQLQHRRAVVLVVEDSADDFELMRIGFEDAKVLVDLHHEEDGEKCMAFLRKQGAHAGAPSPDLILLDLNMPRMNGREVLREIAQDKALCHLPVVILTTSSKESEILEMYKLRCSSYIVKPVDFARFHQVIKSITDYWFEIVVLPTARDDPTAGTGR
jgi:CheY-like chemotaxis protein